jgi:hypothetical protein
VRRRAILPLIISRGENIVYRHCPCAGSAEIINFAEARTKLAPTAQAADCAAATDFDALLGTRGHDRAWLETAYATLIADEDTQAPDVASCRADIATMRELRARKQKMLDMLQADIDRYIKIERGLERQMSIAKYEVIWQLVHGGAQPPSPSQKKGGSRSEGREFPM